MRSVSLRVRIAGEFNILPLPLGEGWGEGLRRTISFVLKEASTVRYARALKVDASFRDKTTTPLKPSPTPSHGEGNHE
jgi:hypothetical protein